MLTHGNLFNSKLDNSIESNIKCHQFFGNFIIYVANLDMFGLILLVDYLNNIVVHLTYIIRTDCPSAIHNRINRFAKYFLFRLTHIDGC